MSLCKTCENRNKVVVYCKECDKSNIGYICTMASSAVEITHIEITDCPKYKIINMDK